MGDWVTLVRNWDGFGFCCCYGLWVTLTSNSSRLTLGTISRGIFSVVLLHLQLLAFLVHYLVSEGGSVCALVFLHQYIAAICWPRTAEEKWQGLFFLSSFILRFSLPASQKWVFALLLPIFQGYRNFFLMPINTLMKTEVHNIHGNNCPGLCLLL